MKKYCIILLIILTLNGCQTNNTNKSTSDVINQKVDSLLNIMTLDEKIGQMNQYNGFWDVTGPSPKNGDAEYKYENLKFNEDDELYFINTAICLKYYKKLKNEKYLCVRNKTNGYWNSKNSYKNVFKEVLFLPIYNTTSEIFTTNTDKYYNNFLDTKKIICRNQILEYIPNAYLKQFKKREPSTGFMLYWFLRSKYEKEDIVLVGFTGKDEDNINRKNWYGHNFDLEQNIYAEIIQKII